MHVICDVSTIMQPDMGSEDMENHHCIPRYIPDSAYAVRVLIACLKSEELHAFSKSQTEHLRPSCRLQVHTVTSLTGGEPGSMPSVLTFSSGVLHVSPSYRLHAGPR